MPVPPQPIGRRPIMARGSRGEPVFADDTDRKLFLETLGGGVRQHRLAH